MFYYFSPYSFENVLIYTIFLLFSTQKPVANNISPQSYPHYPHLLSPVSVDFSVHIYGKNAVFF